jgi:hypothetical protein
MIHQTNCPIWVLVVVILVFQTESIMSFFHEQPQRPCFSQIQLFSKIQNCQSSPTKRLSSSSLPRSVTNPSSNTYERQRRFFRPSLPLAGKCSNTLRAAEFVPQKTTTQGAATATATSSKRTAFVVQSLVAIPVTSSTSTKIGFLGHFVLFLVSTMLVKMIYRAFILKETADTPKPAGIMNRCPWPFIFFHDIQQGFKDSPTWVVMLYMVLWRVLVATTATAGGEMM